MDNPEKLATMGTQNTRRRQTNQRETRMDNLQKLATMDTQNTRRRQTKQRGYM